jgi:hypothetical protein
VRQPGRTLATVRVTSRVSPETGMALVGSVDYDDAPRVVDLARQASRRLGGELA